MAAIWYVVTFAILAVIIVILLTIFLDLYNKNYQCSIYPNIWCWDTWYCPGQGSTGVTGLASSLYGPNSANATICYADPMGPTGPTGCTCLWENIGNNMVQGCSVGYTSNTYT